MLSKDVVLQSIFERTHLYEPRLLNVAVYETWVISSKLMKRPGSTTHMLHPRGRLLAARYWVWPRSEEHTSELQSHSDLVCRLLLEKKKNTQRSVTPRDHSEAST